MSEMEDIFNDVIRFFTEPDAFRSIMLLILCIIGAYILSKFLADIIIKVAKTVAVHADNESDDERFVRLRQIETYLSVSIAVIRALVVAVVAYIAWRLVSPVASSGAAAIGASAFFVVFAGQTLGTVLRDITTGAIIIIEQWYNVGDFIKIEPFMEVSGVVERLTLRSTKLRALNGEVVWIHNQQIASVHVTPHGVRTISVDVFARDRDKGYETLKELANTIPAGAMMLAMPLKVSQPEEWGNGLYRITATGQTAPGREWLIEKFFVDAIKDIDEDVDKKDRVFAYDPIARYADPEADKKFKRAIRAHRVQNK